MPGPRAAPSGQPKLPHVEVQLPLGLTLTPLILRASSAISLHWSVPTPRKVRGWRKVPLSHSGTELLPSRSQRPSLLPSALHAYQVHSSPRQALNALPSRPFQL